MTIYTRHPGSPFDAAQADPRDEAVELLRRIHDWVWGDVSEDAIKQVYSKQNADLLLSIRALLAAPPEPLPRPQTFTRLADALEVVTRELRAMEVGL